jgi:hypothetical protein
VARVLRSGGAKVLTCPDWGGFLPAPVDEAATP